MFDVVRGHFPQAQATPGKGPRPILVTGVFVRDDGLFAIRAAYGTKEVAKAQRKFQCLVIGNSSLLDQLGLELTTAFVLGPGSQQLLLGWEPPRFVCYKGRTSPVTGHLPPDLESVARDIVQHLPDIPMP